MKSTPCPPACVAIGLVIACGAPSAQGCQDRIECEVPLPPGGVIGDRTGAISLMEKLPQSCLKTMVIECSRTAEETLLDFDTAAICSTGYEALLRTAFGGNFSALVAWWQSERAAGRAPGR